MGFLSYLVILRGGRARRQPSSISFWFSVRREPQEFYIQETREVVSLPVQIRVAAAGPPVRGTCGQDRAGTGGQAEDGKCTPSHSIWHQTARTGAQSIHRTLLLEKG